MGITDSSAFRTPPEQALMAMGLVLPQAAKPVASYVPTVLVGNLLYVSGQVPIRGGQLMAKGAVPREVPVEMALECARQCTLNGLAAAKEALGSLDAIKRVVRIGVWVCCEPGYADQPKIANGASDLLVSIFGQSGKHARAAVGSVALPLGCPVEIEFLFEV